MMMGTVFCNLSDISEDYAFDDAALPLAGSILINADSAKTISLTQTREGSDDSYRADLCPKPASSKTLTFGQNITFRTVDGGAKKHDGLWLNYGGEGTTQVSGHIVSGTFIGFGGNAVTVNETGTIRSGKDIQFLSSGTYTIDGNGQYTETIDGKLVAKTVGEVKQYQINGALGLAFAYGTITVNNTAVNAGTLSFGDGWARNPYNPALTMTSTNSVWDVNEIVVRYFSEAGNINTNSASTGTFNFTNCALNVAHNIVNVPHKAKEDGTDDGLLENCSLAMTINLDNSTMTVGGSITNNGTITMDNNSILIANSYENYGTMSISGSEAQAYNSFDNYGIVTVSDGATFTVNGTFTQYGNESKYLAVTNATFSADVLDNQRFQLHRFQHKHGRGDQQDADDHVDVRNSRGSHDLDKLRRRLPGDLVRR